MAKTKDYYDVLGVPRTATQKEISSAFRKLARKHHPDLNAGDKQAEARFKELSEAHDVLSDAKKRKLYDEFGSDWAAAQQAGVEPGSGRRTAGGGFRTQQGGPDVQYRTVSPDEMEDLFGESGSFGDIFGSIFGNATRTRARPVPVDVEAPITVSLGEVYRGTSRTVELPGGRRVEVKIPAGVKEGTVLRVPGLRATVQVLPDAVFTREGKDVRVSVPVSLNVALQGGEVAAPTLKGGRSSSRFRLRRRTERRSGSAGSAFPTPRAVSRVTSMQRSTCSCPCQWTRRLANGPQSSRLANL